MALNKHSQDNAKPHGPVESSTGLESDMAMLASLLTQCRDPPFEGQEDNDSQVDELLKRLTVADGVAKGVEERLDGIIENLDLLLTALAKEPADGEPPRVAAPNIAQEKETKGTPH